jgi:NADPH:quinone reductase-like Zn-dependent oxidoreductase
MTVCLFDDDEPTGRDARGLCGHTVRVRAAVRTRYGGPDVIRFDDVPDPAPGRGEVLVRVHATTVNRTDCAYRSGRPWINRAFCGWPRPRVHVLGSEFAGVVEGVGEGVRSYAVGDRVFGFVDGRPGAHAELVAVSVDGLIAPVPERWDLTDAAPGMEGAHYAHACLRVTGLGPGHRTLVHGATGGIGTALVQLLHAEGVEVTAVCDRLPPGRPDLLTKLGAARVLELAGGAGLGSVGGGFDALVDATGHTSFGATRPLLRPGASYISSDLGRGWQNILLAAAGPVARALGRRHVRFPLPRADASLAAYLRQLMDSGAYRPVVDRTYDFAELRDAYAYVDTGRKVGNVVVVMPGAGPKAG